MDLSRWKSLVEEEQKLVEKQRKLVEEQKKLERNNLNQAFIREDYGSTYFGIDDYGTAGVDKQTHVFFRNLEDHLINFIKQADVVMGCVAWLTSAPILKALALKKGISIIVQKEDFLRPDDTSKSDWRSQLHNLYNDLPRQLDRRDFYDTILGGMACKPNSLIDPVRCVGNYNSSKQPSFPRSHHKFVLFCNYVGNCSCKECQKEKEYYSEDYLHCKYCKLKTQISHIKPYAVWTGSFNFTKNAGTSLENAVVLHDEKIVKAFYNEYAQIAAISEPLNWTANWIQPEWEIQTWT
jgi:hypothetical protein